MKKRLLLLFCSLFLLVACGSEEPLAVTAEAVAVAVETEAPPPTEAPLPTPTLMPTAIPEPTDVPAVEPTAEQAAADSEDSAEQAAPAQSSSNKPTFGDAPFPAASPQEAYGIRADDHAKGADAPDVLIIEYGDFQ